MVLFEHTQKISTSSWSESTMCVFILLGTYCMNEKFLRFTFALYLSNNWVVIVPCQKIGLELSIERHPG